MALLLVSLILLGSVGQAGPVVLMELAGVQREVETCGASQAQVLEPAHYHSRPGVIGQGKQHC